MKNLKAICFNLIIVLALLVTIFFGANALFFKNLFSPAFCQNVLSTTTENLNNENVSFANENLGTNEANFTNLIIFAKFLGEDEFIHTAVNNETNFKELINNSYSSTDYSVKDYYARVSNGKVNMQNLYLFTENGNSLTLSNKRGYYFEKSNTNEIGYESGEKELRMNALKRDWSDTIIQTLANGGQICNVNRTQTYLIDDLDKNGDGLIDNITIFFKYSPEFYISWKDCLWNYQTYSNMVALTTSKNRTLRSHSYVQITYNPASFYTSTYSTQNRNMIFTSLSTMIHETGHVFGLKDLYNTSGNTPIYYMSVMSGKSQHVPQYISAKEREYLGWLNSNNVGIISGAGTYSLGVTSSEISNEKICYKCVIPSSNKVLYLEYRKFDGDENKYDTQDKNIYSSTFGLLQKITIKSGLVCYLATNDDNLPNNMYSSNTNWNYQVLGGNTTKNNSALAVDESLAITSNLSVEVVSLSSTTLTFKVVGTDISSSHTHSYKKVEHKNSTCKSFGSIEHFVCTSCGKYFSTTFVEISYEDTLLPKTSHTPITVDAVAPTCTSEGLTVGSKCKVCGEILTPQTKIDKIAHEKSDWIIDKDSTTLETGSKHKECKNCKQILETHTIPKKETLTPTDPVDPNQPTDPDQPTNPVDPDKPENPTNPDNPNNPTDPDRPNNSPTTNDFLQNKNLVLKIVLAIVIGLPAILIISAIISKIKRSKRKW